MKKQWSEDVAFLTSQEFVSMRNEYFQLTGIKFENWHPDETQESAKEYVKRLHELLEKHRAESKTTKG